MTVQEAVDVLEKPSTHIRVVHKAENGMEFLTYSADLVKAFEMAIEALEKQIPKKLIEISNVRDNEGYIGLIGKCPCCAEILEEDTVYCDCGQKLDWGE